MNTTRGSGFGRSQPPTTPVVPSLDVLAGRIRAEHEQVGRALTSALDHALRAGDLLIEAKAQLGHGQWLPWLAEHCRFAERTAQAYMRLARNREQLKAQSVADLGVGEALALLAAPRPRTFAHHIMPRMAVEEFARLKDSIARHGVLTSVLLDEDGAIIDGYERVLACQELGITTYPRLIKAGLTAEEKLELHLAVNLLRASYTPDQIAAIEAGLEEGGAA
jgi:hypothetical protein